MGAENVVQILAGAVVGAALQPAASDFWGWLRSRKHAMAGVWWQIIPSEHGRPARLDRVVVRRGSGVQLVGRISRVHPTEETGKHWWFNGHQGGKDLALAFGPRKAHPDQSSFGSIALHAVPIASGREWVGAYYRPGSDLGRDRIDAPNLEAIPILWTRSKKQPPDWLDMADRITTLGDEST